MIMARGTYRTYCIAPSFFSWLGRGTSFRTLPEAVSAWPLEDWRSRAVADFTEEVDRAAMALARGRHDASRGRTANN